MTWRANFKRQTGQEYSPKALFAEMPKIRKLFQSEEVTASK